MNKHELHVLQHVLAFIQRYVYMRFQVRSVAKLISSSVLVLLPFLVQYPMQLSIRHATGFVDFTGRNYDENEHSSDELKNEQKNAARKRLVFAATFLIVDLLQILWANYSVYCVQKDKMTDVARSAFGHVARVLLEDWIFMLSLYNFY